jgi:hypothetical protein
MELLEAAKPFLNNGYAAIPLIVAIVAALAKALTMLGQAFDFHDKNIVRKRLERLEELRAGVQDSRPLAGYLESAIDIEKFRICSGVLTSPAKMNMLIALESKGIWGRGQIKSIAKFLTTDVRTQITTLEITALDKVGAAISIIGGFALLFTGLVYFLVLALNLKPYGLIAGSAVCLPFVIVGRLFLTDFINYLIAKKVQLHLAHHPLPSSPTLQSPPPTES